jgi:hypothetical protein
MMEGVVGALSALVLIIVYAGIMFIPTYVAFYRRHEHRLAIGIVNFLLGWMVWALTEEIFHPAVAGTQVGARTGFGAD